ncbi:MAG: riboflavin biosynthesis protein RibF [Bacteroidales bacterium]|nr:riboflavin biosynthesis protein RibF [Bacteroidales bacterium]
MVNVRNINNIIAIEGESLVTVGMFDGVHAGHRHLLRRMIELSLQYGLTPYVVTFSRHPRQVLDMEYIPRMLSTTAERIEKIAQCGVENIILLDFDKNTASMSACEFASGVLCEKLNMKGLLLGYDNMFGNRARNDFGHLQELAEEKGFQIFTDDAVCIGDVEVSSTKIRHCLENGDMAVAAKMLGANYSVDGVVVHGRHVGTTLGFPTANVMVEDSDKILPKPGVYALMVHFDSDTYPAMANLGSQPTFRQNNPVLEVHLLGFNGDLYGKGMRVEFVTRLRDIEAFDTPQMLVEQLKRDREQVSLIMNTLKR